MDRPGGADPIIQVEHLAKDFMLGSQRVQALVDGNLLVWPGEFVAVMGPSGCGKSTLLNMIGGLDRPSGGRLRVDGRDVDGLDENALADYRRRYCGFVFQSFNLVPTMTARQNVEFPMVFAHVPPAQRRERAAALLHAVGLGDRIEHRPLELSGGEQQRVAIARALANRPRIILGDEPTGNLDSKTGVEVMRIMDGLNSRGHTLLVVTHDPRLAEYCHRVVHMEDGRMLREEQGGLARPTAPWMQAA
jgi:putative ABC transport system ATP-binding protein